MFDIETDGHQGRLVSAGNMCLFSPARNALVPLGLATVKLYVLPPRKSLVFFFGWSCLVAIPLAAVGWWSNRRRQRAASVK